MEEKFSTQEMISALTKSFSEPITFVSISNDFKALVKDEIYDILYIRGYGFNLIAKMIEAINSKFLFNIFIKIDSSVKKIHKIDLNKYQIKGADPSFSEINDIVVKIYNDVNLIVLYKEECQHYISIFKLAITYLNSFKKSFSAFILDPLSHVNTFKGVADRERFIDFILTDIEVLISSLKSNITELERFIEILNSRFNILMRADSSIRMLSKYLDYERQLNRGGSKPDTESPVDSTDLSDIKIEKVEQP